MIMQDQNMQRSETYDIASVDVCQDVHPPKNGQEDQVKLQHQALLQLGARNLSSISSVRHLIFHVGSKMLTITLLVQSYAKASHR
jgi:hypothetical protein